MLSGSVKLLDASGWIVLLDAVDYGGPQRSSCGPVSRRVWLGWRSGQGLEPRRCLRPVRDVAPTILPTSRARFPPRAVPTFSSRAWPAAPAGGLRRGRPGRRNPVTSSSQICGEFVASAHPRPGILLLDGSRVKTASQNRQRGPRKCPKVRNRAMDGTPTTYGSRRSSRPSRKRG